MMDDPEEIALADAAGGPKHSSRSHDSKDGPVSHQ